MSLFPKLVCFHAAGGGASSFAALRRALPAPIELTTITLPGRDARAGESRIVDVDTCVRRLGDELRDTLSRPHIMLGHSLGAVIAYSIVRERLSALLPLPEAMVVAACRPPHLSFTVTEIERLGDSELAEELVRHGGLPAKVLVNPEWVRPVVAVIRDDLRIQSSYGQRELRPLACPLHIFGGRDDELVPPEMMAQWSRYSTASQPLRLFDGGHFLFRRPPRDLVSAIVDVVESYAMEGQS